MLKSEVHNLDCLEMMRDLPSSSVSYVITSPPYNMGNSTGGGMRVNCGKSLWKTAKLRGGYESFNDKMPHDKYVAWQKEVLTECWRLLDDAGAIFYNHKPRVFDSICVTPLDYNPGLPLRQVVIWARDGGINFNVSFYQPRTEWIVILAKPGFRLKSQSASGVGDFWRFPQEYNNPHPAPFPYELPRRILESAAFINKPVLDPFSGSGTVRIAAHDFGYDFIGSEVSKQYCEMSDKRYADHLAQPKLFEAPKQVAEQVGLF